MSLAQTDTRARATVFAPRIDALLRDHRGRDLFRLDPGTVCVAGYELADAILRAPADEAERPAFSPPRGRAIGRAESAAVLRAASADVKAALKKPVSGQEDLLGPWPRVGHRYLSDLMLGADPYRLRVLVDRRLEPAAALTRSVIAAGALRHGPRSDRRCTNLSVFVSAARTRAERRQAMGLYRRAAAPLCFTVSALVANALWLGSPFPEDAADSSILFEAMRLLPPSWRLPRAASPEFHRIDPRIGAGDDVLVLPLLSHRDPRLWDAPDEFRPERWNDLDPDGHPGYLPFGHADERWGRQMVMPLAERLLGILRARGLAVSPAQQSARVRSAGPLGVDRVEVVRIS
jgi:Cytochrome P450